MLLTSAVGLYYGNLHGGVSGLHLSSSCDKKAHSSSPFDCANPACSDKMDMFKRAMAAGAKSEKESKQAAEGQKNAFNATTVSKIELESYRGCPVGRGELGASTWNLLHTIAANYPNEPTAEQKETVLRFLETLSLLYPCPYCAEDFQQQMKLTPPE